MVLALLLLQQIVQLSNGQTVEVEVVVLVAELVVVEGVDGSRVVVGGLDGVRCAAEGLQRLAQLLDVAVGRVVVQPAVFLKSLWTHNTIMTSEKSKCYLETRKDHSGSVFYDGN